MRSFFANRTAQWVGRIRCYECESIARKIGMETLEGQRLAFAEKEVGR
jgi:hypothetical protein